MNDPVEKAQKRKLARHEARKRKAVRAVVGGALKTPEGRRGLYTILSGLGIGQTSFNADSVRLTDFALGRQNVGLEFQSLLIDLDADSYVTMLKEAQSEQRELEHSLNAIRSRNNADGDDSHD